MLTTANAAKSACAAPTIERLEGRRLMSFVPIVTPTAVTADNSNYGTSNIDANLMNPQGVTTTASGLAIANNGGGTISQYNDAGVPQPSATTPVAGVVPSVTGAVSARPTGIVSHAGSGFSITVNGHTGPSTFLFATEEGTIGGYNPSTDATSGAIAVNHQSTGDVFKGLAILGTGRAARIFATDFHNGRIEEFNSSFGQVSLKSTAFTDPEVPSGYAPFGIQAIKGLLYVSYARQDATAQNDNPGPAQGIVDIYTSAGKLKRRVATGGDLNSPWGMALAPSNWGILKNDLLVASHGDGTISVFDKHGNFLGQIINPSTGTTLMVTGLWGLTPGTGKSHNTIIFTSAPNSATDGIIGTLVATRPAKVKK